MAHLSSGDQNALTDKIGSNIHQFNPHSPHLQLKKLCVELRTRKYKSGLTLEQNMQYDSPTYNDSLYIFMSWFLESDTFQQILLKNPLLLEFVGIWIF